MLSLKEKMFGYHYLDQLLCAHLDLIYAHFVDPETGTYINKHHTISVEFYRNPPVGFREGSLLIDGGFGGHELRTEDRFVLAAIPWQQNEDSTFRVQPLLGSIALLPEGFVVDRDTLRLAETWSRSPMTPIGGWAMFAKLKSV